MLFKECFILRWKRRISNSFYSMFLNNIFTPKQISNRTVWKFRVDEINKYWSNICEELKFETVFPISPKKIACSTLLIFVDLLFPLSRTYHLNPTLKRLFQILWCQWNKMISCSQRGCILQKGSPRTGRLVVRHVVFLPQKKKHRGRQAYCKIVPGSTETVLQTYHKDLILN